MNRFDPFRQDPMAKVCDRNENCDRWWEHWERKRERERVIKRYAYKGQYLKDTDAYLWGLLVFKIIVIIVHEILQKYFISRILISTLSRSFIKSRLAISQYKICYWPFKFGRVQPLEQYLLD